MRNLVYKKIVNEVMVEMESQSCYFRKIMSYCIKAQKSYREVKNLVHYELMHKDQKCGTLSIDEKIGRITGYHDENNKLSPYLGTADCRKIQQWWELRAVPASRTTMQKVIRAAGCLNTEMYLAKNLGLSMTDTYWVRPEGLDLSFNDVKFSNLAAYSHGKIPYHNATSYDPNASLGGQMEKYWDLVHEAPVLVKESYKFFGQQSVNEAFATLLHHRQKTSIPFVNYTASVKDDRGIECRCSSFTSEHIELLSAHEVLESQKAKNDRSQYEKYIDICSENGIDRSLMQDFMDYQTMTDFLISNTDEHLLNFGILRNADTMQPLGPAPIFDSGNSMFFMDERKTPYSRADILQLPVTGFYKSEENFLKKVKDRKIVRIDLLPTSSEVKELYTQAGIPEEKAEFISKNFETKTQLLSEFQKGKTISFYKEKQAEKRQHRSRTFDIAMPSQKFIMFCGIPGSGKSSAAKELYETLPLKHLDDSGLYSIEKAVTKTDWIFNASKITNDISPNPKYKDAIVLISPDKVRTELRTKYPNKYNDDLVFAIVDARIINALYNKASVIYETTNLDKNVRKKYIDIASKYKIANTELHVMWMPPRISASSISSDTLLSMNERLIYSQPSNEEGWKNIIEHGAPPERSIDCLTNKGIETDDLEL